MKYILIERYHPVSYISWSSKESLAKLFTGTNDLNWYCSFWPLINSWGDLYTCRHNNIILWYWQILWFMIMEVNLKIRESSVYYLAIVLIIFTAFLHTLTKVAPVWPGKPTTTYPLLKIRLVPVLRNVGSTIGQVYRERICMNKHFGAHSNKSIRNAVLRRHRRRRRRCCCFLLQ